MNTPTETTSRVHTRSPLVGLFLWPKFASRMRVQVRPDPGACACMCAWVRAREHVRRCARARARTACVGTRGGASVCVHEWVRARARSERVGVRGGVYVHEAIFSRFKRLSPFGWYQRTTWGSYALRRLLRCLSVPPLVGCGGGLWVVVVCVGVVCSPLPYDWGRGRGCGGSIGGVWYACVRT